MSTALPITYDEPDPEKKSWFSSAFGESAERIAGFTSVTDAGNIGLVAEVHQRLVGVVVQELLDVLGQADAVVEVLRVLDLVVVELEEQLERVVLDLLLALLGQTFSRPFWNL